MDCYSHLCSEYGTNLPSSSLAQIFEVNDIHEEEDRNWMTWGKSANRTEVQRYTTSISLFLDIIYSLWAELLIQHFYTIQQRHYIKKQTLPNVCTGISNKQLFSQLI